MMMFRMVVVRMTTLITMLAVAGKMVLVMFGSEGEKVVGDDEKEDLDNEGGPCHVW